MSDRENRHEKKMHSLLVPLFFEKGSVSKSFNVEDVMLCLSVHMHMHTLKEARVQYVRQGEHGLGCDKEHSH